MGIALLPEWVNGLKVRDGGVTRRPIDAVSTAGDAGIYVLRALIKALAKLRVFIASLKRYIGSPPLWPWDLPNADRRWIAA